MVEEPDLREVGAAFEIDGTWLRATRYGSGHINQTYLSEFDQGGEVVRYVHQAINEEIFQDIPGLMRNVDRVTTHLREKAVAAADGPRWEVPVLVPAGDGGLVSRDAAGRCWRTLTHIENVRTYDAAPSPEVAREAARAFGRFARELADLDPSSLVESIPRFHDLDGRLARLRGVVAMDPVGRVGGVEAELEAVYARVAIEEEFRALRTSGRLPVRVAHNDTKVNNALLDEETGRGVAVIDLDTVMPGTLLFDYGDLVRTASCGAAEDERDLRQVAVDVEMFRAVTEGFLSEVSSIATSSEIEHLLLGGRFMTFIVGLRFLTDYLEGDSYFRTTRPRQNLDRARTQLTLLHSIESNSEILSQCIEAVR
ncbi:MAG: aminoglycoside phosphotransferase family protein [Candidatus Binatia bacterium]|nr:aminoglycoside phosphotransferase family protein [Candidatus Binatia bacterium]